MKNIFTLNAIATVMAAFTVLTGLNDVISGIKAGNAATIAKYFDNTVDITLPGKNNSYSKVQGEAVLRDFFANNTVKSFSIVHQGESGGAQFCIGTLVTSNGSFRTTINLKQKADKQVLQEIKFEK
ncbi:DUF4783 domain-containing protein [Ferruginibacter yonginensis]|uniref:DUF4783 domain-containing protein n=1 Tax=Ferruginibacter yonginensis TaxID=1310416 RepID=A0ABV8QRY4_9BACT